MYAAGKIPGGFIKRESRPSEAAILAMRLTDRPIRPLFPKGYKQDVQIVLTVLSTDQENDPDILAVNGASAALSISSIPFMGPIGAVRVGRIDGEFVTNPTNTPARRERARPRRGRHARGGDDGRGRRQDPARVGHGRCHRLRPRGAPAEHRPAGEARRGGRQAEEAAVPRPEGRLDRQARQGPRRGRVRVRRLRPRDHRHEAGERLHRRHRRAQRARRPGRRPLRVARQPRPLDRRAPDPRHQRPTTSPTRRPPPRCSPSFADWVGDAPRGRAQRRLRPAVHPAPPAERRRLEADRGLRHARARPTSSTPMRAATSSATWCDSSSDATTAPRTAPCPTRRRPPSCSST